MNKRFQLIRSFFKLSQRQFAKELSTSQTVVTLIENGERQPSRQVIIALSERYDVNINWFLNGKGEMFVTATPDQENQIVSIQNENMELKNKLVALEKQKNYSSLKEALPVINALTELDSDGIKRTLDFIRGIVKGE